MKSMSIAFALLMLMLGQTVSQANDLPTPSSGDTWTYLVRTSANGSREVPTTRQFLVVRKSDSSQSLRVRNEPMHNLLGPMAVPWPDARDEDLPVTPVRCFLELWHVTDQGACEFKEEQPATNQGTGALIAATATPDSRQLMATQAGAFLVFPIQWDETVVADQNPEKSETDHFIYWYSLEAKTMVKMQKYRSNGVGKNLSREEWELYAYHVANVKSDLTKADIETRMRLQDDRIPQQISSYTNCRDTNAHKLSDTADGLVELNKLQSRRPNLNLDGAAKPLFTSYQSLGGSATQLSAVEPVADPCIESGNALASEVNLNMALQKSLGYGYVTQQAAPSTKAKINFGTCDKPDYPRVALYLEQEGVTRLGFYVGAYGVVSFSFVMKSSGSNLLDSVALAALSKCHFSAASFGGRASPSWLVVDYVFKLPT
jgi:TonB family protein